MNVHDHPSARCWELVPAWHVSDSLNQKSGIHWPFYDGSVAHSNQQQSCTRLSSIRESSQLGQFRIHFWYGKINKEIMHALKIALRIGPWGSSYGIRERKTVSCKQQIMKTLSNNYRNESYWSGKVADKLCASGCRIWLQWQSIRRGRKEGIHLLSPFLPCGWRNDMSVIPKHWKWSHRLHVDAGSATDTKCTVRNVQDAI